MKRHKKIVCIIPARLASTRFPKKMLANLGSRPMLSWVWDAATRVDLFDDVMFAIDNEQTADVIKSFNGKYVMTSPDCKSGTDRLVELVMKGRVDADIWVNWQGDEPFITSDMILALLQSIDEHQTEMWTLKKMITREDDIVSLNVAKVVCNQAGYALYFSRSPIPCFRDETDHRVLLEKKVYYKHVGLYAFTTGALQKIFHMKESTLEDAEKLEQLRFLDYGLAIKVHETDREARGIDTPIDLVNAEAYVKDLSF